MVNVPGIIIMGLILIDFQDGAVPFSRPIEKDSGPFRVIGVCMKCMRIYFDVRIPSKDALNLRCPWHNSIAQTDIRADGYIIYRSTMLYRAEINQKIVNIDKLEEGILHAAIR